MKKKSKSAQRAKSSKVAKSSAAIEAPAPNGAEATLAAAVVTPAPVKPSRAPRKRATKTTATRYSPEAKAEILQFVSEHDSAKGRGGKSAAVRQFGVSALTLSSWMKASKGAGKVKRGLKAKERKGSGKASVVAGGGIEATLNRMLQIRKEIDSLKAEFESLKARL